MVIRKPLTTDERSNTYFLEIMTDWTILFWTSHLS